MNIYQLATDAALESLRSSTNGLSAAEAARRLAEFGPNRIERPVRVSIALRLLREFTHFFAVILWLAALLAFVADLSQPGQGMRTLSLAIVAVIVVNGTFSFWQEYRAEEAFLAAAARGSHNSARRCRRPSSCRAVGAWRCRCAGSRRQHPCRLPDHPVLHTDNQ